MELVSLFCSPDMGLWEGDPLRVRGRDKAWRSPICLGITVSPSLSHWQQCAWGMCSLHFNYWICPCLLAAGCHCLSISAYPSTLSFTEQQSAFMVCYGLLLTVFAVLFCLTVFVNGSPEILKGVAHPEIELVIYVLCCVMTVLVLSIGQK